MTALAALPTGGWAFCGALEDGMGEVFVSAEKRVKNTQDFFSHSLKHLVSWFCYLAVC